jgi:site-specific DNA recombinase
MNKCILYIRVSTADQTNSLQAQESRLKDYCKFQNLEIVDTIIDEDVSGGKPFLDREGGKKANQILNRGIKTIVVLKLDRIFRDVKDSLITVDEWVSKDISLHIVDMGGNTLNVKSALGRMFFIQVVSMGEFERKLASERTKTVLNHKRENNSVYCREVYGYSKEGNKLVPVEVEQSIIIKIKELNLIGFNNNKIAQELNKSCFKTRHGKDFSGSTIKSILNNPIHSKLVEENRLFV